jgi:hypothetical protein
MRKLLYIIRVFIFLCLYTTPAFAADVYDEGVLLQEESYLVTTDGDIDGDDTDDFLVVVAGIDENELEQATVYIFLEFDADADYDLADADYALLSDSYTCGTASIVKYVDDADEDGIDDIRLTMTCSEGSEVTTHSETIYSDEIHELTEDANIVALDSTQAQNVRVGVSVGASEDVDCTLNPYSQNDYSSIKVVRLLMQLFFMVGILAIVRFKTLPVAPKVN